MGVVDDGTPEALLRLQGRGQAGQVVTVVDVGRAGGLGRPPGPAADRPAPEDQPLQGAVAARRRAAIAEELVVDRPVERPGEREDRDDPDRDRLGEGAREEADPAHHPDQRPAAGPPRVAHPDHPVAEREAGLHRGGDPQDQEAVAFLPLGWPGRGIVRRARHDRHPVAGRRQAGRLLEDSGVLGAVVVDEHRDPAHAALTSVVP